MLVAWRLLNPLRAKRATKRITQEIVEGHMHIKGLTAVALLAALGSVAGCDAGTDSGSTADSSYEGGQTPAPNSSVVTEDERTADQEIAGAGENSADQTGRTGQTGQLGQTDPTGTGTTAPGAQMREQMGEMGESIGMTEFAALDTNSDGKLEQTEWKPDIVGGLEFEKIDEDSSGDIDQDEFRQAVASATGADAQMQDEASDMNTLDDPETEQ